jgi:hypothetical protein
MIAALLIGCTLFARNSLRGQPKLQQKLVGLAVYTALASDVSPYLRFAREKRLTRRLGCKFDSPLLLDAGI